MTHLYIADCTKQGGIHHFYMSADGKLNFAEKTVMDEPMYMAVENSKMYIVLNAPFSGSKESGVISYDILGDGSLENPSDICSTKGEVACHIVADNGSVYCANYVSGSAIKLPDKLVVHSGRGVHPVRQSSPHTHFVGHTPDKKYICVVDLGLDTIFIYNKDMTLFSAAKVPEGHGARHIIFDKDYMFCANELASTLSAFRYEDGTLTLVDTIRVLPQDFAEKNTAAAVRIYKNRIYVSNRGHNSVSEISFLNEKLKLERCIDCKGISPRDFDFVCDIMICTNETSGNVTLFDCADGFKFIGDYKIDKPLCVVCHDI